VGAKAPPRPHPTPTPTPAPAPAPLTSIQRSWVISYATRAGNTRPAAPARRLSFSGSRFPADDQRSPDVEECTRSTVGCLHPPGVARGRCSATVEYSWVPKTECEQRGRADSGCVVRGLATPTRGWKPPPNKAPEGAWQGRAKLAHAGLRSIGSATGRQEARRLYTRSLYCWRSNSFAHIVLPLLTSSS